MVFFVTEAPCTKKTFVEPVPNKALVNHVISNPTVASEEVCKIQCFIEATCESYNFGPKEDGGHVCELSNSDRFVGLKNFTEDHEFLYRGVEVTWCVD